MVIKESLVTVIRSVHCFVCFPLGFSFRSARGFSITFGPLQAALLRSLEMLLSGSFFYAC